MCYSKEIQLATWTIIILFCLLYYIFFHRKFRSKNHKKLKPFLQEILIAFSLIWWHQIFEFLSLWTHNQTIYKTWLILSISSMYFFIRSLEKILNQNLRSYLALILIILVWIHSYTVDMNFWESNFFLKHNSVFIWASAWMFLYIYFNICILKWIKHLEKNKSKKILIIYLFSTLWISFILSLIYTIWGYIKYSTNVCTESASIWCTFFVIQVFILPFFLIKVHKYKVPDDESKKEIKQTKKETVKNIIISLLILILLILILPFFKCLTLKFIFP